MTVIDSVPLSCSRRTEAHRVQNDCERWEVGGGRGVEIPRKVHPSIPKVGRYWWYCRYLLDTPVKGKVLPLKPTVPWLASNTQLPFGFVQIDGGRKTPHASSPLQAPPPEQPRVGILERKA